MHGLNLARFLGKCAIFASAKFIQWKGPEKLTEIPVGESGLSENLFRKIRLVAARLASVALIHPAF